jgi:hypothetical protein
MSADEHKVDSGTHHNVDRSDSLQISQRHELLLKPTHRGNEEREEREVVALADAGMDVCTVMVWRSVRLRALDSSTDRCRRHSFHTTRQPKTVLRAG